MKLQSNVEVQYQDSEYGSSYTKGMEHHPKKPQKKRATRRVTITDYVYGTYPTIYRLYVEEYHVKDFGRKIDLWCLEIPLDHKEPLF